MKSHSLAAFASFNNSKKCLVPGKNAYLVNLVPEKVNIVLASKIIWQQWKHGIQNTKEVQQITNFVINLVVISCKLITVVKL